MPPNPPAGSQHIVPYVYYEDPRAATRYLCDVFGFEQVMMLEWPDGTVAHAEVAMSGERVLIGGADPRVGLASPQAFDAVHTVLCVYVADVEAHYEHAKSQGVEMVREITDAFYGARMYSARDCEGHLWEFREQRSDPSEEELTKSLAQLARMIGR